MKDRIARWLGYQNELNRLRDRCALLEEQRHGARTRSTRNLALASGEKRRADAATQLLIEARQERDQWERVAAACEQTLAVIRAKWGPVATIPTDQLQHIGDVMHAAAHTHRKENL